MACEQEQTFSVWPPGWDFERIAVELEIVLMAIRGHERLLHAKTVRVDELAALASVSATRIRQLAARGKLTRVGRGFVDSSSARAWISNYSYTAEEMRLIMQDIREEAREAMRERR